MPPIDPYENFVKSPIAPLSHEITVTPDDATDLSHITSVLMVAGGGDIAVRWPDGTDGVLPALVPGYLYPFRVARVKATGTTATGIRGYY